MLTDLKYRLLYKQPGPEVYAYLSEIKVTVLLDSILSIVTNWKDMSKSGES